MRNLIISRTPLRVSFMGGGTDLPSYYLKEDGEVISTAINSFIDIIIRLPFSHFRKKFEVCCDGVQQAADTVDEIQNAIVRECLKLLKINTPMSISSFSDVPSGMGMGTSSAFTVGLLRGLYYLMGKNPSWNEVAQEAFYVETELLKNLIGIQDQSIASHGGLCNFIFKKDKTIEVERINCHKNIKETLEKRLMLFAVGSPREAHGVLKEVRPSNNNEQFNLLTQLKLLCKRFRNILEEGQNLDEIGELLDIAWQFKRQLSPDISNIKLDEIYELSKKNGAVGGKLLGAGKSGFMLLYVKDNYQEQLRRALHFLSHIPFKFEEKGSYII